jgi:hypothetical protein
VSVALCEVSEAVTLELGALWVSVAVCEVSEAVSVVVGLPETEAGTGLL